MVPTVHLPSRGAYVGRCTRRSTGQLVMTAFLFLYRSLPDIPRLCRCPTARSTHTLLTAMMRASVGLVRLLPGTNRGKGPQFGLDATQFAVVYAVKHYSLGECPFIRRELNRYYPFRRHQAQKNKRNTLTG